MTSAGSVIDPREKMRARDVSKVARGEQVPRPPKDKDKDHHSPSSAELKEEISSNNNSNRKEIMRRCYETYYDYHKCIEEKGEEAEACKKLAHYYKSTCPDWIEGWKIE